MKSDIRDQGTGTDLNLSPTRYFSYILFILYINVKKS